MSSTAAEALAANKAIGEALYIKDIALNKTLLRFLQIQIESV